MVETDKGAREWWHIDKIDFTRSKSYIKEATVQEHISEQQTQCGFCPVAPLVCPGLGSLRPRSYHQHFPDMRTQGNSVEVGMEWLQLCDCVHVSQ